MNRVLVGLMACTISFMAFAPGAGANPDSADLSVNIAWIGKGTPRVMNGATATWTLTVTNHGPDDATGVSLSYFGTDQWNQIASSCGISFCDLGTVAAGASVQVTISGTICGFVNGESRNARVTASVSASTPDPNDANNSTGDFVMKITGPHGEPCT